MMKSLYAKPDFELIEFTINDICINASDLGGIQPVPGIEPDWDTDIRLDGAGPVFYDPGEDVYYHEGNYELTTSDGFNPGAPQFDYVCTDNDLWHDLFAEYGN
jgi:hypothetical protein